MESSVFPTAPVEELLNRFVKVKMITDWHEEYYDIMEDRFHTGARPLYVILTVDDEVVDTREGMQSVEQFASFLRRGLQKWENWPLGQKP